MLLQLNLSVWNITKIIFGKDNYEILYDPSPIDYVNPTNVTDYFNTNNATNTTNYLNSNNATNTTNYLNSNNATNTTNYLNSNNATNIDDFTVLKVFYPAGSSSPSKFPGGIGFYATPNEIYNATDVELEYSVRFDETFNPVLGGKLPGLFINNGVNKYGGSGGRHTNNTSCRIAWRSEFKAEAYVYLPKNIIQNTSYYNNSIQNPIYGDSLWRSEFKFNSKKWNIVKLRIRLNTFDENNLPNMDGILEMTINNKTKSLNDVILTTQVQNTVQTIIFETFFGGSSPKAVTPNDTWSYFKNIKISKLR